jgi:hypothetical protein
VAVPWQMLGSERLFFRHVADKTCRTRSHTFNKQTF